MTNQEFSNQVQPIQEACERDDDCYFVAHFSRSEDHYEVTANIDAGDALILVRELIQRFKLSPRAILAMRGLCTFR